MNNAQKMGAEVMDRTAEEKARAWAEQKGITFQWKVDEFDSDFYIGKTKVPWPLFRCSAEVDGFTIESEPINFGPDGQPATDPYSRKIEDEIALELMRVKG